MTKNILSLAVAAALTAGAGIAQAQDITIYGHMHYSTDFVTASKKYTTLRDRDDWQTGVNRNSRIGVKGSEDLGNGLKAIFQIESEVMGSGGGGGNVGDRNTYVGLSGDWGTVLMGRHDTPYKIATGSLDLFADTIADYNNNIGSWYGVARQNGFDVRAPQTLAYISPNMNGLTVAAAVVGTTTDERTRAGAGVNIRDTNAVSLAAMYANGPLFASLAYENYEGWLARGTSWRSTDAWKLGLGYKANDFTVGFVYEDINLGRGTGALPGRSADQQNWMLNASYAFGNNVLKAQYGYSDPKGRKNDYENFSIGLDHNLSKRTSLYAIYSNMSNNSGAGAMGNLYCGSGGAAIHSDQCFAGARNIDAVSFGIQHKF